MVKKEKADLEIKSKRKLTIGKVFLLTIFIIYILVLAKVTLLGRGSFYSNRRIYPLFYSYIQAYNQSSFREWRNLVLNIVMFVPFGMLLPCVFPRMQKAYKTYLAGFCTSFFIELLQYVLNRGVCELDDWMNNTIGTMIGYGVFSIFFFMIGKIKKKRKTGKISTVLCLQIPFMVVLIGFCVVFCVYQAKEFGNLSIRYIFKQRNIEVSTESEFSVEREEKQIYRCKIYSPEEAKEEAKEILKNQGYVLDESETLVYDDTVVFYSDKGEVNLWFYLKGGTYSCTNFEVLYGDEAASYKEKASRSEVEEALKDIGIVVPKEAVFEEKGEGNYYFLVDKVLEGEKMWDGSISLSYYNSGKIGRISNEILYLDAYKSVPVFSEKEAYERIEQGKFSYYRENEDKLVMKVYDVNFGYEMDSKGYYQPVYCFSVWINGVEQMLKNPALI